MLALGLDPSMTGFGWSLHDSCATGRGRDVARGQFKTSSKQIFVARYMSLRDQVLSLLDQYPKVQVLGIESPPFGEQWSEGLYGLFLYVNEAVYRRRRDVVYFDPSTVKMLAKGNPAQKGKMFKSDMINAALADTGGVGRWNHNEADAYIVARSAAQFWCFAEGQIQVEDLTPSEARSFARTHTFVRGARAGQTVKSGLIFREKDRFHRFSQIPE